jgi:hypothetical protein
LGDTFHERGHTVLNHLKLWEHIVAPLRDTADIYAAPVHGALPRKNHRSAVKYPNGAVQEKYGSIAVQAVERQNDRAMLVSWSDATLGHFADQRWVSSKSRSGGRCVLTGGQIRRGDTVYKPQRRGAKCTGLGSGMIIAAELERMAGAYAGI